MGCLATEAETLGGNAQRCRRTARESVRGSRPHWPQHPGHTDTGMGMGTPREGRLSRNGGWGSAGQRGRAQWLAHRERAPPPHAPGRHHASIAAVSPGSSHCPSESFSTPPFWQLALWFSGRDPEEAPPRRPHPANPAVGPSEKGLGSRCRESRSPPAWVHAGSDGTGCTCPGEQIWKGGCLPPGPESPLFPAGPVHAGARRPV